MIAGQVVVVAGREATNLVLKYTKFLQAEQKVVLGELGQFQEALELP
jgi:hypothetical protein